jgi:hypothetical protein
MRKRGFINNDKEKTYRRIDQLHFSNRASLSRDTIETICQQIVLDRISAIAEPIEGLCYIVYADAGNRTRT